MDSGLGGRSNGEEQLLTDLEADKNLHNCFVEWKKKKKKPRKTALSG
jgi:hypothetical protein